MSKHAWFDDDIHRRIIVVIVAILWSSWSSWWFWQQPFFSAVIFFITLLLLIKDTIALVDPPAYDRRALANVCKHWLMHHKSSLNLSERDVLEVDLAGIHINGVPWKFGEILKRLGNFERIVPMADWFECKQCHYCVATDVMADMAVGTTHVQGCDRK